jgi:hypothetical protein
MSSFLWCPCTAQMTRRALFSVLPSQRASGTSGAPATWNEMCSRVFGIPIARYSVYVYPVNWTGVQTETVFSTDVSCFLVREQHYSYEHSATSHLDVLYMGYRSSRWEVVGLYYFVSGRSRVWLWELFSTALKSVTIASFLILYNLSSTVILQFGAL